MSSQEAKEVRKKSAPKEVLAVRISARAKRELFRIGSRTKRTPSAIGSEIIELWIQKLTEGRQ